MKVIRTLKINFKELTELYPKIYLDIAFQRKGGWDYGSGWPENNFPDYINSILSDKYANTITMALIEESHDHLLQRDDCSSLLEDIDYYKELSNLGKTLLSIDGWNTTSCIYSFVNNKFPITINGEVKYFKDLHPSFQQKILNKEIGLQHVIGGTKEQITEMFRKMNSSTKLTDQERRQARFTQFARSIRELGEYTAEIFANWVYNDRNLLDQRKHEETLAVLIQAREGNYNKMKPKDLDQLYDNRKIIDIQSLKQIKDTFSIMLEMSKITGSVSSSFRMTRGDLIVFFLLLEHISNEGYEVNLSESKNAFYEFYKQFIFSLKTSTKTNPDEYSYDKWSNCFHTGYSKRLIDLNMNHLNHNLELLENNNIISKKEKRSFTARQKLKAYLDQGGVEPDGKKIPFSDLEKGLVESDHNIPYSKGGKTEENNLVVLTKDTNRKKSDIMPEKFWV
jgi:hypothetical protein